MSKKELEKDYVKDVCLFNLHKPPCRYLRMYNRGWICAKGTPSGEKNSQLIDELLKDGAEIKIKPDNEEDMRFTIHSGDNCPGRAAEFEHLFVIEELTSRKN